MLRRAQEFEAFVSDPLGYEGIQMGRVERLRRRFAVKHADLDEQWLEAAQPVSPYPPVGSHGAAKGPLNILVYYIDTLRYDVADDPSIMPNLVRFRARSLDFKAAYATGSDTLRSLPGLTGGNYFVRNEHAGDLCELAAEAPHESSLFIAKSAREFLRRLRPAFKFEHEVEVPDYQSGREVWGYGADRATSSKIVDAALERLGQRGSQPFFMWLFHFDQHNWREIEDRYVAEVKARHQVPAEGVLNSRYRAIATAIDADFGRMLQGLERLGLSDNTVVLLVSDHGEGLGEGGFWVHSVFLWESLIHVPLALHVPGVPAAVVTEPVSLVDVAPTLSRFLSSSPQAHLYHGEDLLMHAVGKAPERRLPIVFAAALRDELVRIGMLDASGEYKLVVRLEAAQLELYDRGSPNADSTNLAQQRPELSRELLRQLAASPVFPRTVDDFRMLNTKGALEPTGGSSMLPVSAGH
jgi:hypothetical protein